MIGFALGHKRERTTIARLKDVTTFVNRGIAPSYVDEPTGWVAISQKCVRPDGTVAPTFGRPMDQPASGAEPAVLRAGDVGSEALR